MVYLRSVENILLGIIELGGQNADYIYIALVEILEKNKKRCCIDNETNGDAAENVPKQIGAEENDNNQPVGASYEENFIREVQNLGPRRQRRPPVRLIAEDNDEKDECFVADILTADIDEPRNINDAWNGTHSSQWKEATDEE